MNIEIKVDASAALRVVAHELPKAVPYVRAALLTGLAQRVQKRLTKGLPVAFDRPTPFTQRSVFTKGAEKSRPMAEVYFPQSQDAGGLAKREYIRPGAQGASARRQKRSEKLMSRAGILPVGWVTVPGNYIMRGKLDSYGNMPGSYYKQIVNVLQLKRVETPAARKIYKASQDRSAKRLGGQVEFFAVSPGKNALSKGGGWLPPGVYRRAGVGGRELQQYLKFVRKASYLPRLHVEEIARKEVAAAMDEEAGKAFGAVIRGFAAKAGARR